MQGDQITCFELFFYKPSCSRTFPKPKSDGREEFNRLAVTKWSVKIFLEWQNVTKNKSSNQVETYAPTICCVSC